MKLLVGLGNPGKKYEHTRHNIGFKVVEELCKRLPDYSALTENPRLKSRISVNPDLIIAEPLTFMNLSGQAIQSISDYYKIDWNDPANLFAEVRDDLDIPFGQMKIQKSRGAAGHKGAASTMAVIDPDIIWQFRIGIAGETKNTMPGDAYVLAHFDKDELIQLPTVIKRAVDALIVALTKSPEVAAQEVNRK